MQPPDKQSATLPTTVILVGASVRAAAQSARRGSFSVLGADSFGDSDTLTACDQHVLLSVDRQMRPIEELLVNDPNIPIPPIFRVGGLDDRYLNNELHLICPSRNVTQSLKDPGLLDQLAKSCGLRVPETLFENDSRADPLLSGRWLRKNSGSSGGTGVAWCTSLNKAPQPLENHIQRWIPGRSYGATFFADLDRVSLLGVFRSLFAHRSDRPFLYAGSVGPIDCSTMPRLTQARSSLLASILRFGDMVAKHFQLRGLFNVDFIVDRNGMGWILEVNPRWTGASELVERRLIETGAIGKKDSLMRWHILANIQRTTRVLSHDQEELLASPLGSQDPVWIKQVLYTSRPGTLDVNELDTIPNRSSVLFADLPPAARYHRCGEPLLSMIGKLASIENEKHAKNASKPLRPSQWRRAIQETLAKIK